MLKFSSMAIAEVIICWEFNGFALRHQSLRDSQICHNKRANRSKDTERPPRLGWFMDKGGNDALILWMFVAYCAKEKSDFRLNLGFPYSIPQ